MSRYCIKVMRKLTTEVAVAKFPKICKVAYLVCDLELIKAGGTIAPCGTLFLMFLRILDCILTGSFRLTSHGHAGLGLGRLARSPGIVHRAHLAWPGPVARQSEIPYQKATLKS